MKKEAFALVVGAALCVVGCVSTVTEPNPSSKAAYCDRVESRWDRPVDDVFAAAKRALNSYGNITGESAFAAGTNQVRTLSGSVNQNKVWMRMEGVKPSATSVVIQIRRPMGGTDLSLAHELEKGIALQLAP